MTECCPVSGPLLEGIELHYGLKNFMWRFFHWADRALKERGVRLFFASLEDLVEVNRANPNTWRPLLPIFTPELSGVTRETGFVLLGRDSAGEVVATQAARVFDWSESSLLDEAASLRLFYTDTKAARQRGDKCEINTPVAHGISGRVVFSGGGWYRPDFRGKDLGTILPRVSRAYAFTRWNSDFTISIMADAVVAGGFAERTGYTNVEHDAVSFVASPTGAIQHCALVWMGSAQMLADLDAITSEHDVHSAAIGLPEGEQNKGRNV
jgi:hypothetical protein